MGQQVAGQRSVFELMDASVDDIHRAMKAGRLTCRSLVQQYLDRIAAYDQQGPALNAMLHLNPRALREADALDAKFRRSGLVGPLHGIPVVLKDNYDTADLPTTAGSASMEGAQPAVDATVVSRLRQAGALILAKANMQEFALGGVTVSSLGGQTKNPYDLSRTPGGSSGGTAAALAANFAVLGTGSDTANSLRSPASANNIVSIRPTAGLISRAGVVPVSSTQDAVGPITRTVADTARMLDIMAGHDPKDPITASSAGHIPQTYTQFLHRNGLHGARIGVLRTLFGSGPEHAEVNQVMDAAITTMREKGAVVIDVSDPALDTAALNTNLDVQVYEFQAVINDYLGSPTEHAPVHSLADIVASGKFHPAIGGFLKSALSHPDGLHEVDYKNRLSAIDELKKKVADLMAMNRLDVLVYPHQKILPVPIGETNQAQRNGILASLTGCPAITVPAGFSSPTASAPLGVPVGIEFFGLPWSEPQLIKVAYGFEKATEARKRPVSTPPLSG
jgi:Asp-tRNA(Asn)/Glu-tRNA(Gln) amidotransferase A subunit family amidase